MNHGRQPIPLTRSGHECTCVKCCYARKHPQLGAAPHISAAGILQPPIPVVPPINPPPTRNAIDEAFAATRETITTLEAERDLVHVGSDWSPSHHARSAA